MINNFDLYKTSNPLYLCGFQGKDRQRQTKINFTSYLQVVSAKIIRL